METYSISILIQRYIVKGKKKKKNYHISIKLFTFVAYVSMYIFESYFEIWNASLKLRVSKESMRDRVKFKKENRIIGE